jgi:hypothetical protein
VSRYCSARSAICWSRVEDLGDGGGDLLEAFEDVLALARVHPAALLGEVEAEQQAADDLGGERLGGGDRDLGAGVGVEHPVGLAGQGRADHVAQRDDRGALVTGVGGRGDRVGGLARLRDGDHERVVVEDRVAVAELAGDLDLDRDAGPVLDRELADHAGVQRGPAGEDEDLVDAAELAFVGPQLVEVESAVLAEPAEEGLADRLGLLVDLLEHEVLVALLLGRVDVPADRVAVRFGLVAVDVDDLDALGGDPGDLAVEERGDVAGVGDQRGDVGGAVADPVVVGDDQRRLELGDHDRVGLVGGDEAERVGALEGGDHPLRTAVSRSGVSIASSSRSTRWAATSESVSERNLAPSSDARSDR